MIYLGIDPGASGGIAWWGPDGRLWAEPFGETERDVLDQFQRATAFSVCSTFAVIEAVHSFPGQGVASSFAFGRSYGFLRGLLVALGIPFESVSPARWQKAMGVPKTDKKDKKKATKARAQELFPHVRWTHRTADAGLLAEYCRITRARTLAPTPAEAKP